MSNKRPWASLLGSGIAAAVFVGGSVACVGGGGALEGGMTTWDSAGNSREGTPISTEGATNSREPAPPWTEGAGSSSEPGPGAQGGGGGGGFSCSGSFVCQVSGDDDVDTIVLGTVNGNCSITGGDSDNVVFESNGTLSSKGKPIGTWQATPTGFTATADEETITCTRVTGNATPGGGEDDPPPSSSSSGSPGMTPVVDAGLPNSGG
ncbi:MAG: hypothetical protein K0S65_1364 [Labilithrix sp.]|nr:hypothetical protein [Labilithrix sp.]